MKILLLFWIISLTHARYYSTEDHEEWKDFKVLFQNNYILIFWWRDIHQGYLFQLLVGIYLEGGNNLIQSYFIFYFFVSLFHTFEFLPVELSTKDPVRRHVINHIHSRFSFQHL